MHLVGFFIKKFIINEKGYSQIHEDQFNVMLILFKFLT